jgi:hypothetical protein
MNVLQFVTFFKNPYVDHQVWSRNRVTLRLGSTKMARLRSTVFSDHKLRIIAVQKEN